MDVAGLLKNAADKSGFTREFYDERKIPTDPSKITVVPFFGDIRSLFVVSSLLMNRFRELEKGSRYFIIASWPGYSCFFPYADEYWAVNNESILKTFYQGSSNLQNHSNFSAVYYRSLNQYFFEDTVKTEQLVKYYDNGFTGEFWKKYKEIKRFLPAVPSSALLGKELNREIMGRGGYKIFINPSVHITQWNGGKLSTDYFNKAFWIFLIQRLLAEKFVPVVWKNQFSYDLSAEFTDKCIFVEEKDISLVLAIMRKVGFVLDLFSGTSRLALAARCPFLMVDERFRFFGLKEFEIDDLCGFDLPKQYIFSFPTIINDGGPENWNYSIIDNIIIRLNSILPELNRDEWPSTGESTEIIQYNNIRKKHNKRMGTKLLRLPKD